MRNVERFDRKPRIHDVIGDRLCKHAAYLKKNCGFDLGNDAFEFIERNHYNVDAWNGQCVFPMYVFLDAMRQQRFLNRESVPSSKEVFALHCLSIWELSKGIYRFDPVLEEYLPEISLDTKIPSSVLKNLPEWSVYVETPEWCLHGLEPSGFFAYLDYHQQDGFLLKISLDLVGDLFEIAIPLYSDSTYNQVLIEEASHHVSRLDQYLRDKPRLRAQWKMHRECGLFADPSKYQNLIEIETVTLFQSITSYVLPRILYLCSRNRDLVNETNPEQLIRRATLSSTSELKLPSLTKNKTVSVILVGSQIARRLKECSGDRELTYSIDELNGLEVCHSNLPTIEDEEASEREEASMLYLLKKMLNTLDSSTRKLEESLKLVSEDNNHLTAEGIKYLGELEKAIESNADLKSQLLKTENIVQWQQKKLDKTGQRLDTTEKLNLFGKLSNPKELSASNCLRIAEFFAGERISILPDAWMSAEKIDEQFKGGSKLLRLLNVLVTDYLDSYLNDGDVKARKLLGDSYAAQESASVMSSKKLMDARIFSGIPMLQHLRLDYARRLYFCVDQERRRIVIGYCGEHLPIVSR